MKELNSAARLILDLADCHDIALVGGKALNLCKLINAGFPVPGGFVVTTEAHRRAMAAGGVLSDEIGAVIREAWRRLGMPPVAVRSSATAEDLAAASMAGQYETFLDIRDEEGLLDAVRRCWASLDTPRTRAYLAEQGIAIESVAMAVVVQRLVPAEVAGVLFTTNPRTGAAEMVIEASWGLGESVVSGRVQPDILRVDRATGVVLEARLADKSTWIRPGGPAEEIVPEERRRAACLTSRDVDALLRLGLRAAQHFGKAQDLEWALSGGEVFLLQSRDITTLEDAEEYESLLRTTRETLRERLAGGHPGWALHNLAETLPHPTPLTRSVISRFMSGAGGFGALYRLAGFEPSEKVRDAGFLEWIAGRVYMDLQRAPEMFFADFPFRYDPDLLRHDPNAGQSAPTVPCGPLGRRVAVGRRLARASAKLEHLAKNFDRELIEGHFPAFEAWALSERDRDLTKLSADEWAAQWTECERKTLDEFAPRSLLPSLILGQAVEQLKEIVRENFWDTDADAAVNDLTVGLEADLTAQSNGDLRRVARGERSIADWIERYGHRAPGEFDLAAPRWRERPEALRAMAERLAGGADPLDLHRAHAERAAARAAEMRARLRGRARVRFDAAFDRVRRYARFREDGKHYLMIGYETLRRLALEAGRRLDIGEDVFLLSRDELRDALRTGFAPLRLIERRRLRRRAEARCALPTFIDHSNVDELGEAPNVEGKNRWAAFPVSSGQATGPARIVRSPESAGDLERGCVLVCPSTDPAWTPLFVNAGALVLERGGALSHGAVVAREMGLPAVVLPNATALFFDGEKLTVDGRNGAVSRDGAAETAPDADPRDPRIPAADAPPPPGAVERAGARIRNAFLAAWAVFLFGYFALPALGLRTAAARWLDAALWPLVSRFGKVGAVTAIAAFFSAFTPLLQRWLTDVRRLRVAKTRAARLTAAAAKLPKDAPRRRAMEALARSVTARVAAAAFVPLSLLLGPMVLSFDWLTRRIDPAVWNAPAGATVGVQAAVAADWRGPVTLSVPPELRVDAATPAERALPPVRETLEQLQARWSRSSDLSGLPWEVRAAAERARREMLADLGAYLRAGVPPEWVSWTVRAPNRAAGRFTVTLTVGDDVVSLPIVLGDRYPPEEANAPSRGRIQSARVLYPPPPTKPVFWRPLTRFGNDRFSLGWLWLYLIVYAPLMFATKALLRLP